MTTWHDNRVGHDLEAYRALEVRRRGLGEPVKQSLNGLSTAELEIRGHEERQVFLGGEEEVGLRVHVYLCMLFFAR